jgi:hypothetical protein
MAERMARIAARVAAHWFTSARRKAASSRR